jgi:hypothetical protein
MRSGSSRMMSWRSQVQSGTRAGAQQATMIRARHHLCPPIVLHVEDTRSLPSKFLSMGLVGLSGDFVRGV